MGAEHDTATASDLGADEFELEFVADDGARPDPLPYGGGAADGWSEWWRRLFSPRRARVAIALLAVLALVAAAIVALRGRSATTAVAATSTTSFTYSIGPEPLRLAATGEQRWVTDLPARSTGEFTVGREVVAVVVAGDDASETPTVVGLDLDDGSQRWTHPIDGGSAVRLAALPFGVVLVEHRSPDGRNTVLALEEATGDVRWERASGEGVRPAVFPGLDALVLSGVGVSTRLLDPRTGDDLGRVDGMPISIDRRGAMAVLSDDRVSIVELDAAGALGEPRPIAVDPGGLDNVFYVLGDRVVRFDRDGAATLLATPYPSVPGRGQGELGLRVTGIDDFVPTGGIGIDEARLFAIAGDRLVGLELVGDRLETSWERQGVPLAFYPTAETWVIRIGDGSNRTQLDSPTRLIDTRNGRTVAGTDFDIVETTQLLDDGVLAQDASGDGVRRITAHRLDGTVAWTADAAGPARVGDRVVVTLEVGRAGTTVTALGPVP